MRKKRSLNINYFAIPGLPIKRKKKLTKEDVIKVVSEHFGIDVFRINRKKEVIMSRQIIYYILTVHLKMSREDIGKMFGKDHTTIVSALHRTQDRMEYEDAFRKTLALIESELRVQITAFKYQKSHKQSKNEIQDEMTPEPLVRKMGKYSNKSPYGIARPGN